MNSNHNEKTVIVMFGASSDKMEEDEPFNTHGFFTTTTRPSS